MAKRTIRFLGGASMAGSKYGSGDVLTANEGDVQPLVDSGTAEWVDDTPDADPDVDRTTWALTRSQAVRAITAETDTATLHAWHDGERHNPKYPPDGRKGVKDAIEERLGELRVDHAAEGLARGPEA